MLTPLSLENRLPARLRDDALRLRNCRSGRNGAVSERHVILSLCHLPMRISASAPGRGIELTTSIRLRPANRFPARLWRQPAIAESLAGSFRGLSPCHSFLGSSEPLCLGNLSLLLFRFSPTFTPRKRVVDSPVSCFIRAALINSASPSRFRWLPSRMDTT